MAKIIPFKAVRPAKDKVNLVVSRAYEDYSAEELEAQLSFNPFSFLHVVNPGYKFHQEVTGSQRFSLVRNRYLEFKEDEIFMQDEDPSFYIYKIITPNEEFCGIFAGASTIDYDRDVIRKHEETIELREELFKDYLKSVGFNAEPVLLTYSETSGIDEIVEKVIQSDPEYEFTTTDRNRHILWKISHQKLIRKLQDEFSKIDLLYIADGHHRSASSFLLAKEMESENPAHNGSEPYNFFMSYLIPESKLRIYEFNRLIKDLNGLTKEEFLIKLDTWFRIESKGNELYVPSKKHHFCMYLDGEFYSLYLRKKSYQFTDSLSELDTQILYETILKPILGISDLRNDDRIRYSHGKNTMVKVKDLIDSGRFAVGFNMLPVTVEEIRKIADEGFKMPPKSTYVEPKLRSGLTIYEFWAI